MKSDLRVAVIGAGTMGANHVRVYGGLPGVELAAVADPAPASPSVSGEASFRRYADAAEMLDRERIDAVSICAPTGAHFALAVETLSRGIPTLVEKPLAATLDEGERLRDLAAARAVPLAVGHIERFNPAVLELRRRLDAGELGRVYQVHARRVGPFPQRIRDVGVVLDLAPHDIDVMRFLLGCEISRVQAETEQRIATDREDMLSGLLRFENGAVGVLDVNWLTPTKIRQLSVLGERGMFVVDYLARELTFFENLAASPPDPAWAARHEKGVAEGHAVAIPVRKVEPLHAELEAFLAAARGERPVAVTAEDGLAAMRVAQALIEAAAAGRPVAIAGAAR